MTVSETTARTTRRRPPRLQWRVVDIVTAAVLGIATGMVFLVWNGVGFAWFVAMDALTPGLSGLATGVWLLGGVLGGLIIRKPGAALFVETLAATVSMLLGSQWGFDTVLAGLVQGLGAELVFALFLYRRFGIVVAVLAGMGAGAANWVQGLVTSGNLARSAEYLLINLGSLLLSGAVLAGVLAWLLTRALAATGVLSRFASGREVRGRA